LSGTAFQSAITLLNWATVTSTNLVILTNIQNFILFVDDNKKIQTYIHESKQKRYKHTWKQTLKQT
jgi:hypothetical protein